jgi:hypothetical protein
VRYSQVGSHCEYLTSYSAFLNGNPPFKTPPRDAARVRLLVWWILRDLDVRFVRLDPPEVCREIPARRVRKELLRRLGLADGDVAGLDRLIEEQVDYWLLEHGLAGPGWPPANPEELRKLTADFWERRRREDTLPADVDRPVPALAEEMRTLREQLTAMPRLRQALTEGEAELARLRRERERLLAEQKRLQDELARPSPQEGEAALTPLRDERDRLQEEAGRRQEEMARLQEEVARLKEGGSLAWVAAEFRELRTLLTLIDEKYPFESLNELVLAGREPEPPVTLRQFVGHLFFALRKRGLAHYPDGAEFDLTYNESGLYDCLGFEVAPGATVRVAVRSKGWALRNGRALIPIRRARVERL